MTTLSQNLRVGLIATEPEMAQWFFEDIGCEIQEDCQVMTFSNRQLSFEPATEESLASGRKFDVLVGLVRFVDILTLQKLDQLLTDQGAGKSKPCLLLIYRNENESDFKMSCPFCGQKLWVRDADQDKRGRCPHCSKGFTLPDQQEHVISSLGLPASVPVKKIIRQDAGSFASHLRDILQISSVENSLQHLSMEQNLLSNDTMKVNVVDETAE